MAERRMVSKAVLHSPSFLAMPVAAQMLGAKKEDLDVDNGFVFDTYDSNGLFWAMDQAMAFWNRPAEVRATEIARIMDESLKRFNHEICARQYIALYERMLHRDLVKDFSET